MAHKSSKEQIFEYLEKLTKDFNEETREHFTTLEICEKLNMSRSLVSLYLNELVKEGAVIKISSRPVYYLSRRILEEKYSIYISEKEYLSIRELFQEISRYQPKDGSFEKAIGKDGSLNYCITQIKSAMKYPNGLPLLIKGEPGSGKTFMMKLIQQYCREQKFLEDSSRSKRVKISNENVSYEKLFFDKDGLLKEMEGGILYIENVSALSLRMQEHLAEYLSGNGRRGLEGESSGNKNVRLVFSVDTRKVEQIAPCLLMNIPVVCELPSWSERNEDERKEFVVQFFKEEQQRLNRNIYISEKLIYKLVNYHYENNITELKKCITMIAANAYAEEVSKQDLRIYIYHLPAKMLRILTLDKAEYPLMRLDLIQSDPDADKILDMWQKLLDSGVEEKDINFKLFLERGKDALKYYYDILVFEESYLDERLRPLEKIMMEIIMNIRGSYNITLPANSAYVITRMMIAQQNHNSRLRLWEKEHEIKIQQVYSLLIENMPDISYLTGLIIRQVQSNLNIELSKMNKIFLMMNIYSYNHKVHLSDITGIILCHGYTTASSIADTVNTTLQTPLFEAIDMPMDSSVIEVGKKLSTFIESNKYFKNIILMVDTGSLEELGKELDGKVNLGVINNVSTILALNIGNMMMAGINMREILETACRENQCRYSIISQVKKKKAIVFTSDAGNSVAEKLIRLFKESLPKTIDLEMMSYNFENLSKNGKKDILFEKYEVVLLVKTLSLKIPGVTSVTLEEIINFKDIYTVDNVLLSYLNETEIEQFNQALLKNFSLQSVMENLTILNAKKLLDYVSDATTILQHMLKRRFLSKTIIGINMHICFLIERLVTKTPIKKYKNIEIFEKEQKAFVQIVNKSFRTLLNHYNVELPISEIAYLYDYIQNDVEVEGNENQF